MAAKELNNTILRNSTNLMAYYRFETGALTIDDSGNGNTLTNTNTVGEGTGVFGGAADFGSANTNKFLSLGSNLSIRGNGQLSVSFWAKMNTEITTGIQVFFIHNSTLGADRYMQFFYDYNAGSRRFLWDCSGANITKTVALGTTWHHFAMTRPDGDGAVFQAYFDGGCVGTASIGTSPLTRNDVFIGAQTSGANFAASILMDDVAIFNKVLSADEIKELYEGRYIGELPAEGTTQKTYTNELNSTLLKNSEYLKGYWRFEETSGVTAVDSSGNSHDGTASRTNILNNASGKFGNMGVFASASSDEILITDHNDMKPTGQFTVGAWINTSTTSTYKTIFSSWAAASSKYGGIHFYISNGNQIAINSGKNTGTTLATDFQASTGTTNICDGNWHFVIGSWDSSYLNVYVDGKLEKSTAWANAPAYQATNYVSIGSCYNPTKSYLMNGSLDDVFLINGKALSDDEIEMLYKIRGGMVALYHLSNTNDYSGNGYNLTNVNSVSFSEGKFNYCADFGNANTNKYLWYNSNLGISGIGDITVSLWIKLRAEITTASWQFFSHRSTTTADRYLDLTYEYNSGTRRLRWYSATGGYYNITLGTTNWYHLVGVRTSAATTALYINGSLAVTGTVGTLGSGENKITIGATTTPSYYTSAYIDEVTVYNRRLSASEIKKWYAWAKGKYL